MDANNLITVISKIRCDRDRNKNLIAILDLLNQNLNFSSLEKILTLYQFDDDKLETLKIIFTKISILDTNELVKILKFFKFTNSTNEALKLLIQKVKVISVNCIIKILNLYEIDSYKEVAMLILVEKINHINGNDLKLIIESFKTVNSKINAINTFSNKLNYKITFQNFYSIIKTFEKNQKENLIKNLYNNCKLDLPTYLIEKYKEKFPELENIFRELGINLFVLNYDIANNQNSNSENKMEPVTKENKIEPVIKEEEEEIEFEFTKYSHDFTIIIQIFY